MKTAVLIPIRLSSSRLPKKHLIDVAQKPMVLWMINRLKFYCKELEFIIATTTQDFELQEFCKSNSLRYFAGDENNIPKRFYEASLSLKLDNIILVDGDDIVCSENAIICVHNLLKIEHKYVSTSGLPLGMNVMGFSSNYLQEQYSLFNEKKIFQTGCWSSIFEENQKLELKYPNYYPDYYSKLRFTLDYQEDSNFFSTIIKYFGENFISTDSASIINYVIENKLYDINSFLGGEYWKNFNKEKLEEQI